MSISANDVKMLRDRTGAPMMDCKSALTEAGGDMDKAAEILRKRNAAIADKKVGRETAEGRIGVCFDNGKQLGGIIEMRCESAPVAKSDVFIQLANDLAKHVALTANVAANVEALLAQPFLGDANKTVKARIDDVVGLIRENMKPARFTRLSGGLFGSYVHFDGSVGVLLQVEGAKDDPQLLKDICMHITAKQPVAARREDVTADLLEREQRIAKEQAAASGKPANIVERIAEGRMKTWFAENVLVEQPFVKDDSKTVGALLTAQGLTVKKFVRYKVGEIPA